jgi:ferredoxin-type protein NapH
MLKALFPTLSRVRFFVQLAMLVLMVWGSVVVGHYTAEKITGALPALTCAYDMRTASHCELITAQHQIHHRIGMAMAQAHAITTQMVLPLLMTIATFFAFFFVLGKAFCGWVCPLGTIQELIGKIGRRFNLPLRRFESGDLGEVKRVRPVKWLLLLVLVFVFPLMAGLGTVPHSLGNPYCDICPSRIATTLLTGNTEQLAIRVNDSVSFTLGAIANVLFGFMLVAALAMRQPFCRICPMLSFNALFQRLSPLRLVKKSSEHCGKCSICSDACPMDIPEISKEAGRKAYHEDCTLCGRCSEYCPQDGVIALKWGPLKLFASSREYYKNKVKTELPDGTVKPIKFAKNAASSPATDV